MTREDTVRARNETKKLLLFLVICLLLTAGCGEEESDLSTNSGEEKGSSGLIGVYPNPFYPTVAISLDLPVECDVRLELFDSQGRRVGILVDRKLYAGLYTFEWDGSRFASGVYFCRLTAGDLREIEKIHLLK